MCGDVPSCAALCCAFFFTICSDAVFLPLFFRVTIQSVVPHSDVFRVLNPMYTQLASKVQLHHSIDHTHRRLFHFSKSPALLRDKLRSAAQRGGHA